MCPFSGQGHKEVMRLLTHGLGRSGAWQVPTSATIGRARLRLGPEPLKVLFDRVCRPVATRQMVAGPGTTLVAAQCSISLTPRPVAAYFGWPGSGRGDKRSAFPAAATGTDLLWRVKGHLVLPLCRALPDGSYLSKIVAARDKNRCAAVRARR